MFRAGLLLIIRRYYCVYIIRRYYSVYTAISIGHAYTNCCIYISSGGTILYIQQLV